MLATEQEIYALEYVTSGGLTPERRHAMALRAVELHRKACNGAFRRQKFSPNRGYVRRVDHRETPTNVEYLRTVAIAEACRECGIAVEAFGDVGNSAARRFAVDVLRSIPCDRPGARRGVLGAVRAQAIVGMGNSKSGSYAKQLEEKWPMLARKARIFGAALVAEWGTP